MPDRKHNGVTFRPGTTGPRIVLDVDSITRRGGLEPDVIGAVVPYTALDAIGLGAVSTEVAGTIELWYSHAPGSINPEDMEGGYFPADVVLGNWAIVDVEPCLWGTVLGEPTRRAIEYRVAIADHRRAWVAPRGGLLLDGVINPDPLPADATLALNSEIIERCAEAMGVTITNRTQADDADPVREIDAAGAHAPTVLQSVLEQSGTVYAPLISGDAQVFRPGSSLLVTIPPDRLISDVPAKAIDRRGTTVIFTTLPAAEIHSWTDADAVDAPTWRYVAQDPDDGDAWTPLADIAALGGDPAAAWAADLAGVDAEHRPRLKEQMYRCLQLHPDAYPPRQVAVLSRYVGEDLVEVAPGVRHPSLLVPVGDGLFRPAGASGPYVEADRVISAGNVLVFPFPLLKLAGSPTGTLVGRPGRGHVPFAGGDLRPWFSVEAWEDDRRRFGVYGYRVSGASVVALDEAEARDHLTDYRPDTVILRAPDLQTVVVDGGASDNRATMTARAQTYARNAMAATPNVLREVRIKGFLAVELDAAVSEVTYDSRAVETRLVLNGWHVTARTGGDR